MYVAFLQIYLDLSCAHIQRHSGRGQMAQLVGVSSCAPKGCGFDPRSGHIPILHFQSQLGCIREATDGCFFLMSLFPFRSRTHKNILPKNNKTEFPKCFQTFQNKTRLYSSSETKPNILRLTLGITVFLAIHKLRHSKF